MQPENLTLKDLSQLIRNLTVKQAWIAAAVILGFVLAVHQVVYWFSCNDQDLRAENVVLKHHVELEQRRWAEFKLHLDMKSRFNLEKLLVHRYERGVPRESVSIDNEFYALKNAPGLAYSETRNIELLKSWGIESIPVCDAVFIDLAPVHVWKDDQAFLSVLDPEITLYPMISVSKIGKPRLAGKIKEFFSCLFKDEDGILRAHEEPMWQHVMEKADRLGEIDVVGLYWAYMQYGYLVNTVFSRRFDWDSQQVEKTPRMLNATNVFVWRGVDVKVGKASKHRGNVFLKEQVIMVTTGRYIYYIQVMSPTLDIGRDTRFDASVQRWISGLRLIDD